MTRGDNRSYCKLLQIVAPLERLVSVFIWFGGKRVLIQILEQDALKTRKLLGQ